LLLDGARDVSIYFLIVENNHLLLQYQYIPVGKQFKFIDWIYPQPPSTIVYNTNMQLPCPRLMLVDTIS